MAIEGLVRKWLKGDRPDLGARAATQALELADYDALIKEREIYTGFREETSQEAGVFKTILADKYETLPPTLLALHNDTEATWRGKASIKSARNPLAKLIALSAGVNVKAGDDIPLTVSFKTDEHGELWTRNFDGQDFHNHFSLGTGRNTHLAVERFGLFKIGIALVIKENKLHYIPRRCTLFGIPFPKALLPTGESFEVEKNGRFHFSVMIKLPILGRMAAYKGWLEPEDNPS